MALTGSTTLLPKFLPPADFEEEKGRGGGGAEEEREGGEGEEEEGPAGEGGPGARQKEGPDGWAQHLADMKAMEERRYKGILFVQTEEEEEEEEADASYLLSSWPCSSSTTTVVRLQCWYFLVTDAPRVYVSPSGVVRPKMLRIMAGMVQKDSCSVMARLVLLVTVYLVLCFFLSVFRPEMLGIMAGLVQVAFFGMCKAWFAGILTIVPRAVLLLVVSSPKMPVIMAGIDHRTVWRFTGAVLGQGFLHARWCAMCGVMVQTVQYTVWRFRSCSSSRSSTLPFDAQWQFPMVQSSADHRDSPVRIWWSMSLFAGFPQVQAVVDRLVSRSHSCSPLTLHSCCCQLGVQALQNSSTGAVCEKTVEIPLLLLFLTPDLQYIDKVVDCPGCGLHAWLTADVQRQVP